MISLIFAETIKNFSSFKTTQIHSPNLSGRMLWILSIAISVHCSFVILSMTLSSCLPISKERLRTFSCLMAQLGELSQQLHCSYIVLPTFVLMCLISVKITFYLSATSTSMQGQLCSNYFSGADLALGCCFCARL